MNEYVYDKENLYTNLFKVLSVKNELHFNTFQILMKISLTNRANLID